MGGHLLGGKGSKKSPGKGSFGVENTSGAAAATASFVWDDAALLRLFSTETREEEQPAPRPQTLTFVAALPH